MIKIQMVNVEYHRESGERRVENFHDDYTMGSAVDGFLEWLVEQGYYSSIEATRAFSTSKVVMKRLTE